MVIEGVVRDVKGLFQARELLEEDYHRAQEAVYLGIDLLVEQIRSKRLCPAEATEAYVSLSRGIDEVIGEHPLRFRAWRRVKDGAALIKKVLTDAVAEEIENTYLFPERLSRLHPDVEKGKVFLYEWAPERLPEETIAGPLDLPACKTPADTTVIRPETWTSQKEYAQRDHAKAILDGIGNGWIAAGALTIAGITMPVLRHLVPGLEDLLKPEHIPAFFAFAGTAGALLGSALYMRDHYHRVR